MQIYPGFPCFKKKIIFSNITVFAIIVKPTIAFRKEITEKNLKKWHILLSVAAEYLRKGGAKNDEIEVSSISVVLSFFLLCKIY